MTTSTVWTYINPLPDGHRLFFTDREKLVAIADDSGELPQDTDDGVLWLNFDKHCMGGGRSLPPTIPVYDADSNERSVVTDLPTVMLLSEMFNWPLNIMGILYTVQKVGRSGT